MFLCFTAFVQAQMTEPPDRALIQLMAAGLAIALVTVIVLRRTGIIKDRDD